MAGQNPPPPRAADKTSPRARSKWAGKLSSKCSSQKQFASSTKPARQRMACGLVFACGLLLDEAVEDVVLRAVQGNSDGVIAHSGYVYPAGRVGQTVAFYLQRVGQIDRRPGKRE